MSWLINQACLVGVSAGGNGVYPVTEMRISSFKNTKICYTPDHAIVRNVASVLNDEAPANKEDEYTRGRLNHSVRRFDCILRSIEIGA